MALDLDANVARGFEVSITERNMSCYVMFWE